MRITFAACAPVCVGWDCAAALRYSSARSLAEGEEPSFAAVHSTRVGRETRKVLRLASWDLQERFRVAIAQRRAEVEKQKAKQASANLAIDWFDKTTSRVTEIKASVDEVKGLEA